jgi:hypothetical protein
MSSVRGASCYPSTWASRAHNFEAVEQVIGAHAEHRPATHPASMQAPQTVVL